jgi:hypothetical protein
MKGDARSSPHGTMRMNRNRPGEDPVLDHVRAVDTHFFNANRDTDVFRREYIVGEFGTGRMSYDEGPPGYRLATHVLAFRDPVSGGLIYRIRSLFLARCNEPLQWYAQSRRQRCSGNE